MEAHLARLPDVAARIRVARLPLLGAALVMATVVAGIVLTEALAERAYGSSLGVPLPPFFVFWSPRATWLAAVAPLVFAAAPVAVPRLRSLRLGAPGYAASVFGLALGLRLALAAARAGTEGWYSAFASTGHAANEYLPSLPALDLGVGAFLDHFDQVAPTLSLHATAHPPGLLVLLDALSIGTPEAMAWLVLTGGSAAAPLTYLLGRRLLDEPRARLAALLFVFAPSALIWGATSADALFASLGAVAAVLLVAGPLALRALGGASLALASFFSYSLLAVGAWAVLVTGLRTTPRAGVRLAALSGSAVATFYALLWAVAGFDPLGALGAADGPTRRASRCTGRTSTGCSARRRPFS